ncbi:MAG: PilZ domain-containing protein [bacterium]|jgi:hypothetical protein|nr:PilZ domain-containing protein [bacterium]
MASSNGDERRRADRYDLNVPMQLNGQAYHDIELVDISETGIQIRAGNFDIFHGRGYQKNSVEKLRICIDARLAWAEPDEKGGFLTGWSFEVSKDEKAENEVEDSQNADD